MRPTGTPAFTATSASLQWGKWVKNKASKTARFRNGFRKHFSDENKGSWQYQTDHKKSEKIYCPRCITWFEKSGLVGSCGRSNQAHLLRFPHPSSHKNARPKVASTANIRKLDTVSARIILFFQFPITK